ncbi:polysaccharide lyase 8 family protein [Pseudarthrobacter sp. AL07]|uniref:polysaccharide lyase 8 family protein n=2 Tax=unclassified Pseudarthrobacter TaxID=2647000 RepID=UPI002499C8AF|nr:polysaccharide lyase 8 family protein [Pseudarthrobacter sp. AL07]MDI3193840.1 polysaccharide lyase 8 family protein [Pseudarthrobacter sp. AL20]MDI3207650.1 polysaccharide lyase 8 family protein [Pseudarthrobacter sp. AL07]
MMTPEFSRRSALKGAGGAALSGLLLAFFHGTAHADDASDAILSPSDFAGLRQKWVDQITGRRTIVAGDSDFVKALATLDKKARTAIDLLDHSAGRSTVFSDLSLAKNADLVTTHTRLATLATAWATPGSAHYADKGLLAAIRAGLADANSLCYNETKEEQGNWWSWEIGTPKALADTMVLLHAELTVAERTAYCAAIDHFVPDPWQQFPPQRGKITSVGANRVDLCQAIIIRSLVDDNPEKLTHAVAGLSDVWQYVSSGNGFFTDGSFIQHSTTPYTGSYGVVLLTGLSKLFALLGGTGAEVADPSREILFNTVEGSFAPFMVAGAMADSVRGRSISREANTGFDLGASTIESILLLARAVDPLAAGRWRSLCQAWIAKNSHAAILADASVPRTALIKELFAMELKPTDLPRGHYLFPAMDRTMHHNQGWTLSTAMASNRIAWYECGNGENNRGYHTGSGMTYIYDADLAQYDDAYWATANYSRLPGITVDTTPLPDKAEGEWGAATPANEWTGSAAYGEVAAVGEHLIGPGGTGLRARKSWFVSQDVMVCLGADIRTASASVIETVVDHRNLHSGSNAMRTAAGTISATIGSQEVLTGDRWVHLEGFGGYIVLDAAPLHVLREQREGSWSEVNAKGSTARKTRNYATLYFTHGQGAEAASYAYLVAPGASADRTSALSGQSFHTVLRNDEVAQAVRFKKEKTTAATFWRPGAVGDLAVSGPACVVIKEVGDRLSIAVSDPTQAAPMLSLRLRTKRSYRIVEGQGASLIQEPDGFITLAVETAGRAGVSMQFELSAEE